MKKITIRIFVIWACFCCSIFILGFILSRTQNTNENFIQKYEYEYFSHKEDFNQMILFFDKYDFDEKIIIEYIKGLQIDSYNYPYKNSRFEFLKESKFLHEREDFIYHYKIHCYKKEIEFYISGIYTRNKNGKSCGLVYCPNVQEYYPNCKIYSNGYFPSDTDTNCVYWIEDNWYVRCP